MPRPEYVERYNQDESRRKARENTARDVMNHERSLGRDPSYESVVRHVNERADMVDKKKDRNIKE